MSERPAIEFIDLKAQRQHIGKAMDEAILKVVHDGNYILGQQVQQFETELAAFCGAKHAIGVANGTDALILVLEALGIGPGDAVICPSFTFAATAEVVAWMGATPVFAEIDEATYNIDRKGLAAALETAKQHKLTPRALITVDLFGQACDYEPIEAFCKQNGLVLISDSAQGYGARYKGRVAGAIGDFATTSFFPAKPLGCYGTSPRAAAGTTRPGRATMPNPVASRQTSASIFSTCWPMCLVRCSRRRPICGKIAGPAVSSATRRPTSAGSCPSTPTICPMA